MSDSTINRFLASGTAAERAAFTPSPPTPSSGPDHTYFWYETDTGNSYAWDRDGAAWGQVNGGLVDGDYGDISISGGVWTVDAIPTANASEVNTGTNAVKAITADALAGSNLGTAVISVLISDPNGSAITTGDGKAYWPVPSTLNGMDLISARASLSAGGTGGGFLMQLRRKRSGADVDMLSTRVSIDSGEDDSNDAATPPVIDTTKDDVATNDRIFFDLDGVPTGAKGLVATLQFRLP